MREGPLGLTGEGTGRGTGVGIRSEDEG